jgi:hypothetical protein
MARNAKSVVEIGSRGVYRWLTTSREFLDPLLAACPQAVLNKHLAVTSLDSGLPVLNEHQRASGWENRNGIAYSPKLQSVQDLPHDGYDEWYIFQSPADLGQVWQGDVFDAPLRSGSVAVFVNFSGFSLHDPGMLPLFDLFWTQLELIRPESFIADGDFLNFVSRDRELFAAVCAALA